MLGGEDRIVLGNRRCPFEDKVVGRPALCMMTSNVFGGIAAENLGYAKVEIQQAIARGDAECQVVVHLRQTPECDAADGREYVRGWPRARDRPPAHPRPVLPYAARAEPAPVGGRGGPARQPRGDQAGRGGAARPGRRAVRRLVADYPDRVRAYLDRCARSKQLVPGGLTWRAWDGRPVEIRCDGAVVRPREDDGPAVVFLRCRPRTEATDQFVLLNQKIEALTKEVVERRKAEWQRDELLAGSGPPAWRPSGRAG